MRVACGWKDYELLDCSDGKRLERWGSVVLIRPDPQVIWKTERKHALWDAPHAEYIRSSSGGGNWEFHKKTPDSWQIAFQDYIFCIKTTGFKHTGIFPEQAVNWTLLSDLIKKAGRPVKALNLFAYTGAATVACLKAGAQTVHVDAAKGMVAWARENAAASSAPEQSVRWIVDDCAKFVQREIRRGNKYDIIMMDPPSYGRGPGGEIWKLEDEIYRLVTLCRDLLHEKSLMLLINSYTTGLSPSVMQYILGAAVVPQLGGTVTAEEIGLPVSSTGLALPCGATSIWRNV